MPELTEADLQKAVDEAVGPLKDTLAAAQTQIDALTAEKTDLVDKLAELDSTAATTKAITDAVNEAIAPLQAKVSELQSALDAAEIARGKAETGLQELTDALEAAAVEQAADALRAERIEAVKATKLYPEDVFDESVAVNKDRIDAWVAMEQPTFDLVIEAMTAGSGAHRKDNGPLPTGRSAITDALTTGDAPKGTGRSGILRVAASAIPNLVPAGTDS